MKVEGSGWLVACALVLIGLVVGYYANGYSPMTKDCACCKCNGCCCGNRCETKKRADCTCPIGGPCKCGEDCECPDPEDPPQHKRDQTYSPFHETRKAIAKLQGGCKCKLLPACNCNKGEECDCVEVRFNTLTPWDK